MGATVTTLRRGACREGGVAPPTHVGVVQVSVYWVVRQAIGVLLGCSVDYRINMRMSCGCCSPSDHSVTTLKHVFAAGFLELFESAYGM